uniref:PH domain-containing protein n=1 Tax=Aureoumbra lagunensis TaxID=44058 RepID=A0A7S3NJX3_9STRA|mmetsp:Transcript_5718/g.8129  ORF Transcript_5718/g.8129 Transcript_5718/m.8129 type:complete len:267 (+) Transcript_5718:61-861(+)|eukprot:CAMPEP_0197291136 /NCGR_PEP_ID=MMETSP0890-20130614/11695_1 /TAXON_ID=44058 ORGANISM="Aureoumbra lagunensis, Strain CCMP1510" /NCGR_SAMPLE_ID=MMETSP0890 /ASSEMBLY_ACC=CAM_ASM_000533 /LENGTH=266 /DNA_ID=CAMNT_0042763737 /DNA_START=61 /DNA_END=861 /DNA_ORIENTATION=+
MKKDTKIFEGWEYRAAGYSTEFCDESGKPLRIKGLLLKKGGSRKAIININGGYLNRRRNWSLRWFYLDLNSASLRYFIDEDMERKVGEIRFLPGAFVQVPHEVKLRGRHAPRRHNAPVYYLELHRTADAFGKERAIPFALRATSHDEFNDWIKSLTYCVKSVGSAGHSLVHNPGSIPYEQNDFPNDITYESDNDYQSQNEETQNDFVDLPPHSASFDPHHHTLSPTQQPLRLLSRSDLHDKENNYQDTSSSETTISVHTIKSHFEL